MSHGTPPPQLLAHLLSELGEWPPRGAFQVTASPTRDLPTWDGTLRPMAGMLDPAAGLVLCVPPARLAAVEALGDGWRDPAYAMALAQLLGLSGEHVLDAGGIYRWSVTPTPTPDRGEWVPHDDPRVPEWLRPFGGDVLVEWDDDGTYGAGVGIKVHDGHAEEIAVGTEPALRGRGVARLLVATAARAILARGKVALYLHAPDNHASAKVADAAGFPDSGWRIAGLWHLSSELGGKH